MKKTLVALLLVLGIFIIYGCAPKVDIPAEQTQIKTVLDQNVKAMETEDINLIAQTFSQEPSVVIIGTAQGQEFIGWAPFSEAMNKQFVKYDSVKAEVMNQMINVHSSGKVAWFSEMVNLTATTKVKEITKGDTETKEVKEVMVDKPVNMPGIRFTGVLEKTKENKWVIVQSHMSMPIVETVEVVQVIQPPQNQNNGAIDNKTLETPAPAPTGTTTQ